MKPTPQQLKRIEEVARIMDHGNIAIAQKIFELEDEITRVSDIKPVKDGERGLQGKQGEKGGRGEKGDDGEDGKDGRDGIDGRNGTDGQHGRDGRDGKDGINGRDGKDGVDGRDGKDAPIVDLKEIKKEIEDVRSMATINAMPVTTSFFNGIRAKNLNIVGATVTQIGDTANVTVPSGGGGISPLTFTGSIDGSNTSFTPSGTVKLAIVDGGRIMAATSADGTVNWTGNIALSIAPNFDLILLG